MYRVYRKQMQLHLAYVHRDSHIHSPGGKHGSAGDASVPLPRCFLIHAVCLLLTTSLWLFISPNIMLVWETCTWSHGESTIFQWHRVLASLQFYWSATGFKWSAVPGCWSSCWKVNPDLLCPEFISQSRSDTEAKGLGRIPSSAKLTHIFLMGPSMYSSIRVLRSIW